MPPLPVSTKCCAAPLPQMMFLASVNDPTTPSKCNCMVIQPAVPFNFDGKEGQWVYTYNQGLGGGQCLGTSSHTIKMRCISTVGGTVYFGFSVSCTAFVPPFDPCADSAQFQVPPAGVAGQKTYYDCGPTAGPFAGCFFLQVYGGDMPTPSCCCAAFSGAKPSTVNYFVSNCRQALNNFIKGGNQAPLTDPSVPGIVPPVAGAVVNTAGTAYQFTRRVASSAGRVPVSLNVRVTPPAGCACFSGGVTTLGYGGETAPWWSGFFPNQTGACLGTNQTLILKPPPAAQPFGLWEFDLVCSPGNTNSPCVQASYFQGPANVSDPTLGKYTIDDLGNFSLSGPLTFPPCCCPGGSPGAGSVVVSNGSV